MQKSLLAVVAMLAIVGCQKPGNNEENGDNSKNDILVLNETTKTLNHLDEWQIETVSDQKLTFTSTNEYSAEVSESGLVKAMYIGEADIVVSNGVIENKVNIIVEPKVTMFTEPLLDFSLTRDEIISQLGKPDSDSGDMITYEKTGATLFVGYTFDDNGRLDSAALMVDLNNYADIANFLLERYPQISTKPKILFADSISLDNATMVIGLETSPDMKSMLALYMPYSSKAKSQTIEHNYF